MGIRLLSSQVVDRLPSSAEGWWNGQGLTDISRTNVPQFTKDATNGGALDVNASETGVTVIYTAPDGTRTHTDVSLPDGMTYEPGSAMVFGSDPGSFAIIGKEVTPSERPFSDDLYTDFSIIPVTVRPSGEATLGVPYKFYDMSFAHYWEMSVDVFPLGNGEIGYGAGEIGGEQSATYGVLSLQEDGTVENLELARSTYDAMMIMALDDGGYLVMSEPNFYAFGFGQYNAEGVFLDGYRFPREELFSGSSDDTSIYVDQGADGLLNVYVRGTDGWQQMSLEPAEDYTDVLPVTVTGTDGRDFITLDNADDYAEGGEGGDRITGLDGHDTIYGGGGRDRISGGDGDDNRTQIGTDENGAIYRDAGLFGGGSHDWLYGGEGDDDLFGGFGYDDLYGGAGRDELFGGLGKDKLRGNHGDDELYGGYNDDDLNGGKGDDRAFGGDGDDKVSGYDGDDVLFGGRGDDILHGGRGNDRIWAERGDDTVRGGDGSDHLDGGDGTNLLIGGQGADRFAMSVVSDATNTVKDFVVGEDTVSIRNGLRTPEDEKLTFDDIFLSQEESTAVIAVGDAQMRLHNTNIADLDEDDIVIF